jgi:phosphate transport system substrate-binding protein
MQLFIRESNDTLIALADVILFIGKNSRIYKGLVFDNPNSSTVRYINNLESKKPLRRMFFPSKRTKM